MDEFERSIRKDLEAAIKDFEKTKKEEFNKNTKLEKELEVCFQKSVDIENVLNEKTKIDLDVNINSNLFKKKYIGVGEENTKLCTKNVLKRG